MKWYFQHLPGETQDMDEVFENVLVDAGGRKSLFKMGKLGILWQLDRTNGQFIRAADLGYQTIVQVNPQTGKVTYLPGKIPQVGVEVDMCPSTAGFKSWRAMAFSPQTNAFYIPISLSCEKATFGAVEKVVGKGGTGPVGRTDYKHPESGGNLGEFLAMDTRTEVRGVSARHRHQYSGARGRWCVFGDWDRHVCFRRVTEDSLADSSGLLLRGFPIAYQRGSNTLLPAALAAELTTLITPELAPEIHRPNSGNALLVSLPGK
jgi:alcohol dehydrogenase (cytochrome c)